MQGQEKALLGFGKAILGQLNPWGLFVRVRWQQRTLAALGTRPCIQGFPQGGIYSAKARRALQPLMDMRSSTTPLHSTRVGPVQKVTM